MAKAFVVTFRGDNATLDNYKAVLARLQVDLFGRHPDPDCLFHWVRSIENGFRVTDVWSTRERFDQFMIPTFLPACAELGIPEPQISDPIDVENYLTEG